MVRKCCVPDCTSNYDAALRNGQNPISTFKFPDDPELRKRWIHAVKKDDSWNPGRTASVCINHFHPEDILKYDKPAKLKLEAVPSIFGLILKNTGSVVVKRGRPKKCRTEMSEDKLDCKELAEDYVTPVEDYVTPVEDLMNELIIDFESFNRRIAECDNLTNWYYHRNNDIFYIYNIDEGDENQAIRIENSIKIFEDMKMSLFIGEVKQADDALRWILGHEMKICRWSQFETILQKYDKTIYSRDRDNNSLPVPENTTEMDGESAVLDSSTGDRFVIDTIDNTNESSKTIKLEIEENFDSQENIEFLTIDDNNESTMMDDSDFRPRRNPLGSFKQRPLTFEERLERKTVRDTLKYLRNVQYNCFICNTEHETSDELEHHLPEHISMLPYNCKQCVSENVTLKTLASLNKHFLMHLKPLKCRNCDVRFSSYGTRLLHERNLHSNKGPLTCDICGKTSKSIRGYQHHRKVHVEPERMRCQICEKALSSSYELKLHMRVHTKEKPNQCPFCDAKFNRVSNLVAHKRRYHFKENPFVCTVCEERFRLNTDLARHMLCHDSADVKATKRKPLRRVSKVTETKDYQCKICDKRMTARTDYHSHMRKHRKPYQCSYCGLQIGQRRDFMDHENTHTGNRPYKCEICSKRFQTSSTYYGHRKVHLTEKQFACDICDRRFSRLTHLTAHSRTHSLSEREQRAAQCDETTEQIKNTNAVLKHEIILADDETNESHNDIVI
ncbi:zinc finger protein 572-like [Malaya genurostris]|uniref:zinc finger protein 572-like n=1 Tax=Malaya genurostris TaxID=325434 RepID=UPI0026F3B43A|nr:zinc finger protein 572-like [Malaya genurostris]